MKHLSYLWTILFLSLSVGLSAQSIERIVFDDSPLYDVFGERKGEWGVTHLPAVRDYKDFWHVNYRGYLDWDTDQKAASGSLFAIREEVEEDFMNEVFFSRREVISAHYVGGKLHGKTTHEYSVAFGDLGDDPASLDYKLSHRTVVMYEQGEPQLATYTDFQCLIGPALSDGWYDGHCLLEFLRPPYLTPEFFQHALALQRLDEEEKPRFTVLEGSEQPAIPTIDSFALAPNASRPSETVAVSTVTELLAAIAPHRVIEMAEGDYHLEQLPKDLDHRYASWLVVLFDEIVGRDGSWPDDDYTLMISEVDGLTLRAAKGATGKVRILTNRRSASVMAFENCENLTLDGVVLGHDMVKYKDPDDPWMSYCSGEVLEFFDCTNVMIDRSTLFGCGTRGFLAHRCTNVLVRESIIEECSWGAFGVFDSKNVLLQNTQVQNNTYRNLFEIDGSSNVVFEKVKVMDNKKGDEYSGEVIKSGGSTGIDFRDCTLRGNDFNRSAGFDSAPQDRGEEDH